MKAHMGISQVEVRSFFLPQCFGRAATVVEGDSRDILLPRGL